MLEAQHTSVFLGHLHSWGLYSVEGLGWGWGGVGWSGWASLDVIAVAYGRTGGVPPPVISHRAVFPISVYSSISDCF